MADKQEISATVDIVKGHKTYFEAVENRIRKKKGCELVGELGVKSCAIIEKELQDAKTKTLDYFVQFNKNMEIVENNYKNISALGRVLKDENIKFFLFDMEIQQDEIYEIDLENELRDAEEKYKVHQINIANKRMRYHDAYQKKMSTF
jgi:hypothetical protein